MNEKNQKEALFWSKLIYPVIFDELKNESVSQYFKRISEDEIVFPNGQVKKPGLSTLWYKLKIYRKQGFEALARDQRSDLGKIRSIPQEVLDKAIEIKKDQPKRSHTVINLFLEELFGVTIPKSTLYRHLKYAGATKQKLGITKTMVRCRWTRHHTHSLWTGDFQHGPYVFIEGRSYKTYLSAFIDVHSRYAVEARYYLRENKRVLEDTLMRAWSIHGASKDLYVDNAKVYKSKALRCACLTLKINLIHRRPRDPQGGGIIEKFFQTVQSQFESEIRANPIISLDQLNQAFSAWLASCYHQTVNSETKQTPQDRYDKGITAIRRVDVNSVIKYFYEHQQRTVHRDFSDISIYSKFFKVDPKFRGDRVNVYFDCFSPLEYVLIYSLKNQFLGKAFLHQRQKQKNQPVSSSNTTKPSHDFIALLLDKHNRKINKQIQGIDYRRATADNNWPFLSFIQSFAKLLGRKGGASAFSAHEYESLSKIHKSNPLLNESILLQAFEIADYKTIPDIVFQIQLLLQRKDF